MRRGGKDNYHWCNRLVPLSLSLQTGGDKQLTFGGCTNTGQNQVLEFDLESTIGKASTCSSNVLPTLDPEKRGCLVKLENDCTHPSILAGKNKPQDAD